MNVTQPIESDILQFKLPQRRTFVHYLSFFILFLKRSFFWHNTLRLSSSFHRTSVL